MVDYQAVVRLVAEAHKVYVSQSHDQWYTKEELKAVKLWNEVQRYGSRLREIATRGHSLQYEKVEMPERIQELEAELAAVHVERAELEATKKALHDLRRNPYSGSAPQGRAYPRNHWDFLTDGIVSSTATAILDRWKAQHDIQLNAAYQKIEDLGRHIDRLTQARTKGRAIRVANNEAYIKARDTAEAEAVATFNRLPGIEAAKERAADAHRQARERIEFRLTCLRAEILNALNDGADRQAQEAQGGE